jgi:hypothetical protein
MLKALMCDVAHGGGPGRFIELLTIEDTMLRWRQAVCWELAGVSRCVECEDGDEYKYKYSGLSQTRIDESVHDMISDLLHLFSSEA